MTILTLKERGERVAFLESKGYKFDTRLHDGRALVMSRPLGDKTCWIDSGLKHRYLIDKADRVLRLDTIVW